MTIKEQNKIIEIISTHPEGEGQWCDTGEDMEWSCRDKCVELAIGRLQEFFNQLT